MSEPFHSQEVDDKDINLYSRSSTLNQEKTEEDVNNKPESMEEATHLNYQPRSIDDIDTNDLGTQSVNIYATDIQTSQEESYSSSETMSGENAEQIDISEENEETPPPIDVENMGPGEQLAYYRTQRRLSKQHIADKLYLSPRVIKFLEADDYKQLPPSIFVRGYIRNYAKILEIPAEPLLESYERRASQKFSPTHHHVRPQVKKEDETTSGDSWFKILTSVILMVALVLMALWQIYPPDSTLPVPEEDPNEETVIAIHSIPIETDGSENDDNAYTPPSEGNGETENTSDTPTNTNGNNTANTPPTVNPAPKPAVNPNVFTLSLSRDTWMKISDAEDKTLFNGIGKAGKQVSLEGKPPFNIKVGHTQGITLEYKETTMSLKDYPNRRGRTFIIGTESGG